MSKHELDEIAEKLACVVEEFGYQTFLTRRCSCALDAADSKDKLLSNLREIVGCDYAPLIEALQTEREKAYEGKKGQCNDCSWDGYGAAIDFIKTYAKEQKQK